MIAVVLTAGAACSSSAPVALDQGPRDTIDPNLTLATIGSSTTAPRSTTTTAPTTTTEAPPPTTGSGTTPRRRGPIPGVGGGSTAPPAKSGLAHDFCYEIDAAYTRMAAAMSEDPFRAWKHYVEMMEVLAQRAPAEISDDFALVAKALGSIDDELDFERQLEAIEELGQAMRHIDEWQRVNCAGLYRPL